MTGRIIKPPLAGSWQGDLKRMENYKVPSMSGSGQTAYDHSGMCFDLIALLKIGRVNKQQFMQEFSELWDVIEITTTPGQHPKAKQQ